MEISLLALLFLYCLVLSVVCKGLYGRLKKLENKKSDLNMGPILETIELQKSQIKQLKNRIVTLETKKR